MAHRTTPPSDLRDARVHDSDRSVPLPHLVCAYSVASCQVDVICRKSDSGFIPGDRRDGGAKGYPSHHSSHQSGALLPAEAIWSSVRPGQCARAHLRQGQAWVPETVWIPGELQRWLWPATIKSCCYENRRSSYMALRPTARRFGWKLPNRKRSSVSQDTTPFAP